MKYNGENIMQELPPKKQFVAETKCCELSELSTVLSVNPYNLEKNVCSECFCFKR